MEDIPQWNIEALRPLVSWLDQGLLGVPEDEPMEFLGASGPRLPLHFLHRGWPMEPCFQPSFRLRCSMAFFNAFFTDFHYFIKFDSLFLIKVNQ